MCGKSLGWRLDVSWDFGVPAFAGTAFGVGAFAGVEEEADESAFWLELIMETNLLSATKVEPLLSEANEIVAIMGSSKKTAAKSQIANRKSAIR